ncbi:hypothetical protein BDA96_04G135800 [Sorghum bicolor]|uniref:Uncharacterized protein n=2 Tax=Sorghum bicolor TaxID=4558 RepID=A0A921R5Z8_SORBI|nr:hypothetical protein BDA96_04G135800 [Sorghum bicolor]OQU84813.1 hypothetical protein SORBI_3004G127733 [Sorghum bicolor]
MARVSPPPLPSLALCIPSPTPEPTPYPVATNTAAAASRLACSSSLAPGRSKAQRWSDASPSSAIYQGSAAGRLCCSTSSWPRRSCASSLTSQPVASSAGPARIVLRLEDLARLKAGRKPETDGWSTKEGRRSRGAQGRQARPSRRPVPPDLVWSPSAAGFGLSTVGFCPGLFWAA